MEPATQLETLSGDLGRFVSKADVSMIVGRIEQTHWMRKDEDNMQWDVGPLDVRVLEVLHGMTPHRNELIEVPARRVTDPLIRIRNRHEHWNSLHLAPGDILLIACRVAVPPSGWKALAADQIESPTGPEVQAVLRAYRIEESPGGFKEQAQMLESALTSNQDILQGYSVDYLTQHANERREAVEILHRAILSSQTTPERKLELAFSLTGQEYLRRDKKGDAANQIVVGTLAAALVHERDTEDAAAWTRLLASAVLMEFSPDPKENHQVRLELIRSVRNPPARAVVKALSNVAAHSEAEDRAIAQQLLQAWESH